MSTYGAACRRLADDDAECETNDHSAGSTEWDTCRRTQRSAGGMSERSAIGPSVVGSFWQAVIVAELAAYVESQLTTVAGAV